MILFPDNPNLKLKDIIAHWNEWDPLGISLSENDLIDE